MTQLSLISSNNHQNNSSKSQTKQHKVTKLDFSKLNSAQKQAVETIEGPVLIVAGPGTGKTTVLTNRIAYILKSTDVPPDAILALTFTESGVIAMKRKLSTLIGPDAYKVSIYTFHGFCNSLITDYNDYFNTLIDATPLSDLERTQMFTNIIDVLDLEELRSKYNKYTFLKRISDFISNLKREGITLERFKQIVEIEHKVLPFIKKESSKSKSGLTGRYVNFTKYLKRLDELVLIYSKYQELLKEQRRYDYDDMINVVVDTLEKDENFLSILQERFQYILVDEYQDTNTAQNQVVFKLASFWGDKANVFVVGDDDQSIYRFQGASVTNIIDFVNTFKNSLNIITLTENYRSQQTILDASFDLITHSKTSLQNILPDVNKKLTSKVQLDPAPVKYAEFTNNILENMFIVDEIKKLQKQGVELEEIAVLVRKHKHLNDIIDLLQRNKIPYVRVAGENALDNIYLQQFLQLLRIIQTEQENPNDDSLLFRTMHFEFLGIPHIDIVKLARYISIQNRKNENIRSIDIVNSEDWKNLAYTLGLSKEGAEKIKLFYDNLSKWYADTHNYSLAKYIEIIMNESGLIDYVLTLPSKFEDLNAINSFFIEVKALTQNKPDMSIDEFMQTMDLIQQYDIKIKLRNIIKPKGGVQLLTAHASKGLEFEYVFVPKFSDRHWGDSSRSNSVVRLPNYVINRDLSDIESLVNMRAEEVNRSDDSQKAKMKQSAEEDSRRLFYVAMTRAKKMAYITFSNITIEEGGKDKEEAPSRFIHEISNDFIDLVDVSEYNNSGDISALSSLLSSTPYSSININTVSDKQYIKAILSKFRLSSSAITTYLEDPTEFYLRYLLRVPSVPAKPTSFGNATHYALKVLFEHIRDKGQVPDLSVFLEAFIYKVQQELLLPEEQEELIKKAKKELPIYYKNLVKSPTLFKPLWLEKIASTRFAGIELTGILDKVEIIDDKKGIVRIVDYKTGRIRSPGVFHGKTKDKNDQFVDGIGHKYKFQLYFYKLLFDNNYLLNKGKYNAVFGKLEFVEPQKGYSYLPKPIEIEFLPEELEVVKQTVVDVWQKIQNLEFE